MHFCCKPPTSATARRSGKVISSQFRGNQLRCWIVDIIRPLTSFPCPVRHSLIGVNVRHPCCSTWAAGVCAWRAAPGRCAACIRPRSMLHHCCCALGGAAHGYRCLATNLASARAYAGGIHVVGRYHMCACALLPL